MKIVLLIVAILNLLIAGLMFFTRDWPIACYLIGGAITAGTFYAILARLEEHTQEVKNQTHLLLDAINKTKPGIRSFEEYQAEKSRS